LDFQFICNKQVSCHIENTENIRGKLNCNDESLWLDIFYIVRGQFPVDYFDRGQYNDYKMICTHLELQIK